MSSPLANRQPVALGETAGSLPPPRQGGEKGAETSGTVSDEDALQARLDALRRS